MAAPETPGPDPAEAWLREQQRYWEAFRDARGSAAFAEARAAWSDACDRWWHTVAETVPAPMAAQVRSALEQTRLCLELAGGIDPGSVPGAHALSPDRLFAAAADAVRDACAGADPLRDAAYLEAFRRCNDLLARVIRESLERIRARLQREGPVTPRQVHAVYVEELEAHYLEAAAGDEFARAVGDLVNAWVDAVAAGRARVP